MTPRRSCTKSVGRAWTCEPATLVLIQLPCRMTNTVDNHGISRHAVEDQIGERVNDEAAHSHPVRWASGIRMFGQQPQDRLDALLHPMRALR